jgi:23S rRNA (adenine2503-C2)-methyltransferase
MHEVTKVNLKGMNQEELESFFISLGHEPYRGKQMMKWMYQKGDTDFGSMTDFGKPLRELLTEKASISELELVTQKHSREKNTQKYVFALSDGHLIESVIMSYEDHLGPSRMTACISTQVGCAMGCTFCASSLGGLKRSLTAGEIVDQVLQLQKILKTREMRIANVVMMGIGEPLENLANVLKAVKLLVHPDGICVGSRHIAISSCGIPQKIRELAEEPMQVKLAISLHSPDDAVRSRLMPINRKYPLGALVEALHYYHQKTNRRITIEYTLIKGLNDSEKDAIAVTELLKGLSTLINLIPLNAVPEFPYQRTPQPQVERFREWLEAGGIKATIRKERGLDIDAACGQLRRRSMEGR